MPPRSLRFRCLSCCIIATFSLPLGCSKSENAGESTPAYAASGGNTEAVDDRPSAAEELQVSPSSPMQPLGSPDAGEDDSPAIGQATPMQQPEVSATIPLAADGVPESTNPAPRELRPDLSAQKLVEFLAGADQDMQLIATGRSGIQDPQEARDLLVRIVKMKLEASRRLAEASDATEKMQLEGHRGRLQALSHLASLGDLKAAKQLKTLAEGNLQSSDPKLVADSRLVLIGFAIESLQNGDEDAPKRIVQYINKIASSRNEPDVPTMMVMGQARQMLASYGHDDEARRIRDTIIDLFADSPEPQIADMAAQLAGNVRFDAVEKLRSKVMEGGTVSVTPWQTAVKTLIDESADLQTVQYLAGAALEFESIGQDELVDSTYDVMSHRFDDPASATGKEVKLAIKAMQARKSVVGRKFDPDLPSADGSARSIADYRGKVVLMPFWAMSFPESLQIIPQLKQIREANADDVEILGMNLDPEGASVKEFLHQNNLGFANFHAESSATPNVANPVAAQFGLVSMPFVAILDQQGRVAAINFTGRGLEELVQELINR